MRSTRTIETSTRKACFISQQHYYQIHFNARKHEALDLTHFGASDNTAAFMASVASSHIRIRRYPGFDVIASENPLSSCVPASGYTAPKLLRSHPKTAVQGDLSLESCLGIPYICRQICRLKAKSGYVCAPQLRPTD